MIRRFGGCRWIAAAALTASACSSVLGLDEPTHRTNSSSSPSGGSAGDAAGSTMWIANRAMDPEIHCAALTTSPPSLIPGYCSTMLGYVCEID